MPTDPRARGLDRLLSGDTEGGIADLHAHLAGAQGDAGAWLAIGVAFGAIGQLAEAEDALGRAARLAPDDPEALAAHARVLRRLGVAAYDDKRHDEAAAWLSKAIAAAPDDARSRYALGVVEEARGDLGAAVSAYREAVRHDPRHLDARRTLADALAGLGEHEAAIAELDAVLAIDPHDAQAARNRDVLARAIDAMARARLLGKSVTNLEASALLVEGGFRARGPVSGEGARVLRWTAPLVEVYATLDDGDAIHALLLRLTDPARASRETDDTLGVTVIADDGRRAPADLGTALTLTFLREALGCPLTQASAIYARLLREREAIVWGEARIGFSEAPAIGIEVRRV
jgi:tetratricopeptide (TPR) repeat protein